MRAAFVIAVVVVASMYSGGRGAQHEQAELKAAMQAAQKALADADARQQSRTTELGKMLGQLNAKKSSVRSPT